jgi:hypothetical protein
MMPRYRDDSGDQDQPGSGVKMEVHTFSRLLSAVFIENPRSILGTNPPDKPTSDQAS